MEGRRSALLQAGSEKQAARIDPAVLKAIREQVTAFIGLLCAGWDLPHWDSRAKAVLFICKAAGEELAGEHGPGFRATCQPGRGGPALLPDGFAFRDVLGRVPCARLSN